MQTLFKPLLRWTFVATLALGVPLATGIGAAAESSEVTVTLSNFSFEPKTVTIPSATPIALTLVNTGPGGHSFAAPKFFKAVEIAPEDAPKVKSGKVEVKGGNTVVIHLKAPVAGRYALKCSHAFHSTFGMKGEIIVN